MFSTAPNEILIVIGSKNGTQVYGGKSYIIPHLGATMNIISTGTLYSGAGNVVSSSGVRVLYDESANSLTFKAFNIASGASLLMRVYYR